jgi:hypothetical protein
MSRVEQAAVVRVDGSLGAVLVVAVVTAAEAVVAVVVVPRLASG